MVVVNKPGASGTVGTQQASISKPDGYTLLVTVSSMSVFPESTFSSGGRKPTSARISPHRPAQRRPHDPGSQEDSQYKSVADIIADAKKRPGRSGTVPRVYGPPTCPPRCSPMRPGSNCAMCRTRAEAGADRSAGGHVDILFSVRSSLSSSSRAAKSPLAVASEKRHRPSPTFHTEGTGYDVEYYMWCGFFAPKGTPRISSRPAGSHPQGRRLPEFKAAMEKMNTPSTTGTPTISRILDQDAQRSIEAVRRIGKVQ